MEEKHGPTPGSFEGGGCIDRKRGHEVALGARRRVFLNQFSGEVGTGVDVGPTTAWATVTHCPHPLLRSCYCPIATPCASLMFWGLW